MGFTNQIEYGINVNVSTSEYAWRLIYSGDTIISLTKHEGVTKTIHNAYMSTNFKDIVTHILSNGINYHTLLIRRWEEFYTETMKDLSSPEDDDIINMINDFNPNKWTLVHYNGDVINLTKDTLKINQNHTIFIGDSLEECFDEVTRLSLSLSNTEWVESYDDYINNQL